MTSVMYNPWNRTFTLEPLAPLTVISPMWNMQHSQNQIQNLQSPITILGP
jgi:hypothetical protein